MAYAKAHGVPVDQTPKEPFSRDANLWHISHEGGSLEDVAQAPPPGLLRMSVSPQAAPDAVVEVDVAFTAGVPTALDGMCLPAVTLLERLNTIAGNAGIGTVDMVEDRLVGVKSRGVYETPGGTVLFAGLEALRSVALDRRARRLLGDLAETYAELLYDGLYFTPSRIAIEAAGDVLMAPATGHVRLALYKGNVQTKAVEASQPLYDTHVASFDETGGGIVHADAAGFMRLYTLPLRTAARAGRTHLAPDTQPTRVG
jgi:argininosuccinate synthase